MYLSGFAGNLLKNTTMITLKTLENTDLKKLHTTFLEAFSDYLVPIKLTGEQFQTKLLNEGVDLSISGGAFLDNKMVGIILHGRGNWNGQSTAYNAGTGVIPTFRGQGITLNLYSYLIPILQENGVESCLLEVMQQNVPAINVYKEAGYEIKRKLDCYKLSKSAKLHPIYAPDFAIIPCALSDSVKQHLYSWHNWAPTWQNSWDAMLRNKNIRAYMATLNNKSVGYITVDILTGRVPQFATHPVLRGQGIGNALFHKVYTEIDSSLTPTIINVDNNDASTRAFLQKAGFEKTATQYEMEMNIEETITSVSRGRNTNVIYNRF
jgi:ribosomal protein S18 acetylase RimI-like enzyme